MLRPVSSILPIAVVIAACSSGGASSSTTSTSASSGTAAAASTTAPTRRGNANLITTEEVRESNASNALEVVQKLRPQLLLGRGSTNPNDKLGETTQPKAYLDNVPIGEVANLRNVPAMQIKEIRYINGRDATTRWGTGHIGGVILVITK